MRSNGGESNSRPILAPTGAKEEWRERGSSSSRDCCGCYPSWFFAGGWCWSSRTQRTPLKICLVGGGKRESENVNASEPKPVDTATDQGRDEMSHSSRWFRSIDDSSRRVNNKEHLRLGWIDMSPPQVRTNEIVGNRKISQRTKIPNHVILKHFHSRGIIVPKVHQFF